LTRHAATQKPTRYHNFCECKANAVYKLYEAKDQTEQPQQTPGIEPLKPGHNYQKSTKVGLVVAMDEAKPVTLQKNLH